MAFEHLCRSRSRPHVDTMYSRRSDSNASLNVLVSTPISAPKPLSFPTLPSPGTSTPSSDDDDDSFFLGSPAASVDNSLGGPAAQTATQSLGGHLNRLSEITHWHPRPAPAPNVLTKRRRSQNNEIPKPMYRNSIRLQPQALPLGVCPPASCPSADSPNSRSLEGVPDSEVTNDTHGLLMHLTTAVSQYDPRGSSNGLNCGNKFASLSAPPSAYKGTALTRGTSLDLRLEVNNFPSPRIRRPSQKLTKRRPPSVAPPPIPSVALLSELSPSPLSLEDITAAKPSFQPAPPPVPPLPDLATGRSRRELADNKTSTKRWNRLSLKELADREEMVDSLPSARPRTLFKLPPTSQKWKARKINFLSSVSTPVMPSSGRTSTGTDKLASFAWTGVILPSPESSTEESHSEFISSPSPQAGHPEGCMSHIELKRGLTLAMAMADDELTDEVLVEELEKMRRKSYPDQQYLSRVWMRQPPPRTGHVRSATIANGNEGNVHLQLHDLNQVTSNDAEEAATWHIARRALLCCREIVRTEKRYQEKLKALLDGDTMTAPPSLMLTYLPALISVSENLLKGLSQDPSAWGVSTAFMACEEELESAMVAWSGVAGEFFTKKRRSWRKSYNQNLSFNSSTPVLPLPSSAFNLLNGSTISFPVLGKYESEKGEKSSEGVFDDKESDKGQRPERRASVRDLAILPTQRVVRYVMLYRDLLAHTPHSSPSRALVEQALEVAQRIASKCDHAQGNDAFHQPRSRCPSSPTSSRSPFRSLLPSGSIDSP